MRNDRPAAGGGPSDSGVAGRAGVRAGVLLLAALVLGIVLLQSVDWAERTGGPAGEGRQHLTSTSLGSPTTLPARSPKEVKVVAANGTTVRGLAGRVRDKLAAAGYNMAPPNDASRKPVEVSTVYFAPGYEAEAKSLAQSLQIGADNVKPLGSPSPVEKLGEANVVVVAGQDKANSFSATSIPSTRKTSGSTTTSQKR